MRVALTGATYVELVPAPPEDVAYKVGKFTGTNLAASANRSLTIAFKNSTTYTILWLSGVIADGAQYNPPTAGEVVQTLDFTLSSTDHSIVMKLDDTGTDTIVASYEILEA